MTVSEPIKSAIPRVEVLLTPRDLATAIGASESSLRRWIDNGDIRVSRTAGGHRRIPLSEAVQFIRKMGAIVVRPEVLNLPLLAAPTSSVAATADEDRLFAALRDGQRDVARGLALSWYLKGQNLHALFDGPVRSAMHRLGDLWKHDQRGVLIEHRATDICLAIIATLRGLLPPPEDAALLAMGAAPRGDPYQIPTLMAATVLAEAGLRDVNFGADTPLELLAAEAITSGARLVWLSISAAADPKSLRAEIKTLAATLGDRRIDLVIGGSASAACALRALNTVKGVGSMSELAAYGRGLLSRVATAR